MILTSITYFVMSGVDMLVLHETGLKTDYGL